MASLVLNERPVDFQVDPATPLLWVLRDVANLTGAKYGCGTGSCGACMVLVDGEAMASCTLTLAEAQGRSITTIEGLRAPAPSGANTLHPVQQALIDEQAIQCGFCTPGMVIALAALLARNPRPTDEDIRGALTNLCRCGVYPRVIGAVRRLTGPVIAVPAAPGAGEVSTPAASEGTPAGGEAENAVPDAGAAVGTGAGAEG